MTPTRAGSRVKDARAAGSDVEAALDSAGWPWNLRLWRWLDALLVLE